MNYHEPKKCEDCNYTWCFNCSFISSLCFYFAMESVEASGFESNFEVEENKCEVFRKKMKLLIDKHLIHHIQIKCILIR